MYFQTQREIWCHLITGTLPNATVLAEAYQSWIALEKFGQNLARKKLDMSTWIPASKSASKAYSNRLFKNRCAYMIYSFDVWSSLQDHQGACGVESSSMRLSLIQEHEILEMLNCFNELMKEVKIEKQNHISNLPFMNDPRCRSAPDNMFYRKYAKGQVKGESSGAQIDIEAAGDQNKMQFNKAVKQIRADVIENENDECPQEFNVDVSGEESSGSCESGSESESDSDDSKSVDSSGTIEIGGNYENIDLIKNVPGSPKRTNSSDSLITNDNYDERHSSGSENSSQNELARCSSNEDLFPHLDDLLVSRINRSATHFSENRKNAEDEDAISDGTSSGFEFIEEDFDLDLPPRPNTS